MTARERGELRGLVSWGTGVLRAGLFVLVVVLVGWVARLVQAFVAQAVGLEVDLPFWLMPTFLFGAFLYVRGAKWTGGRTLRSEVRRDLERGEVARHFVRVVEALEAPEVEDEGPVFFVLEEGGTTLFFSGQEMVGYKRRGFPWKEFEIAETPVSHRFLRLRALDASFENVQTRPALSYAEAKELGVFSATYGVLEKTLDELRGEA